MNGKFILAFLFIASLVACTKPGSPDDTGPYLLSYGDSILYMKPVAGDYIVKPLKHRPGTYTGFPEGIEIDETTKAKRDFVTA